MGEREIGVVGRIVFDALPPPLLQVPDVAVESHGVGTVGAAGVFGKLVVEQLRMRGPSRAPPRFAQAEAEIDVAEHSR